MIPVIYSCINFWSRGHIVRTRRFIIEESSRGGVDPSCAAQREMCCCRMIQDTAMCLVLRPLCRCEASVEGCRYGKVSNGWGKYTGRRTVLVECCAVPTQATALNQLEKALLVTFQHLQCTLASPFVCCFIIGKVAFGRSKKSRAALCRCLADIPESPATPAYAKTSLGATIIHTLNTGQKIESCNGRSLQFISPCMGLYSGGFHSRESNPGPFAPFGSTSMRSEHYTPKPNAQSNIVLEAMWSV